VLLVKNKLNLTSAWGRKRPPGLHLKCRKLQNTLNVGLKEMTRAGELGSPMGVA